MNTFNKAWIAGGLALAAFAAPGAQAQTYTLKTLWNFSGAPDGRLPVGTLTPDGLGNLYGTTQRGGTNDLGAVYKYNAATGVTVLASFNATTNGQQPFSGVVRDAQGSLYGTTTAVGSDPGTLFKYSAGGGLTKLATFSVATGYDPRSPLVLDSQGNIFGATASGGASNNYGTVFKYSTSGGLAALASFNFTNGSHPYGSVVMDGQGNLFGTTQGGGGNIGFGAVFMYTAGSGALNSLGNFNTPTTGIVPVGGLISDGQGTFYGTTSGGGTGNAGTIFRYTASKGIETLASFAAGTTGNQPRANLILDGQGNLFGTTNTGGTSDLGTVFKYTTGGGLQTLATFNGVNGQNPLGALTIDNQGNIYGTAYASGPFGNGSIFVLSPTPEPSQTAALALGTLALGGLVLCAKRRAA